MRLAGEICLFTSWIAVGYAAALSFWRVSSANPVRERIVVAAFAIGFSGLTATVAVLVYALVMRDYRFQYVAQYVSPFLPPQYRFSALWVGQAGSLLLWSWMIALVALALRLLPSADDDLRNTAFGLLLINLFFLLCVVVFAADPLAPSIIAAHEGAGLSPLLQHPSMLIHPPIVFLAYSVWAVPCALALAALTTGKLAAAWTNVARPWALAAWTLLGVGLLLGAHWAYQELGWGGYWGWDPVENGSLLPWLTGTAFIHSLMTWRHRGALKKTALLLAVITLCLCNFATFLTRSGIFSSVHAFSESPIGWLFLAWMAVLLVAATTLVVRRRRALGGAPAVSHPFARESLVIVALLLILSLAAVVFVGTLVPPLSRMFAGRTIEVGAPLYNNVLPPVGLGLLTMTALVPLLQWADAPTLRSRRLLGIAVAIAAVAAGGAWISGSISHPLAVAVVGLVVLTLSTFVTALLNEALRSGAGSLPRRLSRVLITGRRKYAAYGIHFGFVCVALGIAGSSLGTQRQELTLDEGQTLKWAGRRIHYTRLIQRQVPDKLIAEAVLEIEHLGSPPVVLRPARHLHLLQNQWTTEVAINSTWAGDVYTILNAGLGGGKIAVTFVYNPLIRWIWVGGLFTTACALISLWPSRRRGAAAASDQFPATEIALHPALHAPQQSPAAA